MPKNKKLTPLEEARNLPSKEYPANGNWTCTWENYYGGTGGTLDECINYISGYITQDILDDDPNCAMKVKKRSLASQI